MGSVKFSVHPLFFVLGLYYAFTGKILVFVIYTITAVIHELGHSEVAGRRGYKLNKIILMPFGAVVMGDYGQFTLRDQLSIAFAGPLINILTGLIFVAFWWIFPETYAYTDIVAQANFAMAFVNLIPAYPLDGGRVLFSLLSLNFKPKTAFIICKSLGYLFSALLFFAFLLSIKTGINISLALFCAFIFCGTLSVKRENSYVKTVSQISKSKLLRGMPYKTFGIEKSARLKTLLKNLDGESINCAEVYDGDKIIKKLSQNDIESILERGFLNDKIAKYI